MIGWLVVNHFIKSDKFNEIFEYLEKAAKFHSINMIRKTNAQLMCFLYEHPSNDFYPRPDFILFWDKDIKLARFLESNGFRLFNSANAIEVCDDKSLTHINLYNSGIKMPKTIIFPKIFDDIKYDEYSFIDVTIQELGFPLVIKECFGSFGQQVYLAKNYDEVIKIVSSIGTKPMLFQEFIVSSKGRDIRINVVGGQPIATMFRYTESDDFRANISNGAKMKKYNPTNAQIELAIEACKRLGLDFAGVDILFGDNDEPILCEINSNAHFKNIYDCTGINTADYIIKHIKKEIEG